MTYPPSNERNPGARGSLQPIVELGGGWLVAGYRSYQTQARLWLIGLPQGAEQGAGPDQAAPADQPDRRVDLDIFWLRDESLEDSAVLPDPDVLAAEIMEDLQVALAQFSLIPGEPGDAILD